MAFFRRFHAVVLHTDPDNEASRGVPGTVWIGATPVAGTMIAAAVT